MSIFNDIFQGVGDVTRAGFADVQNHYMEFLTGKTAPTTSLTADMVVSSSPQEEPQSFDAALRKHSDGEQAEIRAGYEAGQRATPVHETDAIAPPSPAPEIPGYEPEL